MLTSLPEARIPNMTLTITIGKVGWITACYNYPSTTLMNWFLIK